MSDRYSRQEIFGGMDRDLMVSNLKNEQIADNATYQKYWAATPAERRLRLLPIPLEVLIQLPDLSPDLGDRRPVPLAIRDHPRQRPLGVDPAGRVRQHVILPRPVAEDHQTRRHPMSDQAAQ